MLLKHLHIVLEGSELIIKALGFGILMACCLFSCSFFAWIPAWIVVEIECYYLLHSLSVPYTGFYSDSLDAPGRSFVGIPPFYILILVLHLFLSPLLFKKNCPFASEEEDCRPFSSQLLMSVPTSLVSANVVSLKKKEEGTFHVLS